MVWRLLRRLGSEVWAAIGWRSVFEVCFYVFGFGLLWWLWGWSEVIAAIPGLVALGLFIFAVRVIAFSAWKAWNGEKVARGCIPGDHSKGAASAGPGLEPRALGCNSPRLHLHPPVAQTG